MEKNIQLAIQLEEEYLNKKVNNGDGTINIYDYLLQAGYNNIDEFHKDAQEYWVKSQNMILERVYINEESLDEWVTLSMSNQRLFRSSDIEDPSLGTVAIVGKEFNDYDNFMAHGVYPVVFNYMRGCIITGIDDLNFCLSIPNKHWLKLNEYILNKLANFISKKYKNVIIADNDILVNNQKVVGLAIIENNYMSCIICHISLTDYLDLIYELCPPHGDKEPGYILNITKKEFEDEIQSWLHEQ